jgi:hypothetical protein
MFAHKRILLKSSFAGLGLGLLAACSAAATPPPQAGARPNPSVEKCLADGYATQARIVNGVPVEYDCIDQRTGLRCDAWAYFRGECRLKK